MHGLRVVYVLPMVYFTSLLSISCNAMENQPFTEQEQLQQSKEIAQWKQDRENFPRIQIEKAACEKGTSDVSLSQAAFYVKEIVLDTVPEELDFLAEMLPAYENRTLNLSDIEELVQKLNRKLQDKGYATSEVVIPEQNIGSGTLKLHCGPGKLRRVVYAEGSKEVPWQNAFPIREGDILNVRMLEEGLENMKRVPSLDVSMKILPTGTSDLSDLELTIHNGKQVHGRLSFDNSGGKETGKNQFTAAVSVNRVFNANDVLFISNTLDTGRKVIDSLKGCQRKLLMKKVGKSGHGN